MVDLPKFNFDEQPQENDIPDFIPNEKKLAWDLVMRDVLSPWGVRSRERLKQKLQTYHVSELLEVPTNRSLLKTSNYSSNCVNLISIQETSLTHFLRHVSFAENDDITKVLEPKQFTAKQKNLLKAMPSVNPGNLGN